MISQRQRDLLIYFIPSGREWDKVFRLKSLVSLPPVVEGGKLPWYHLERVCSVYASWSLSFMEVSQHRTQSGTETGTMEENHFLGCSSWLSLFSHTAQPWLPRCRHHSVHSGWVLSQQSLFKKTSHILACRPNWWQHFLNWAFLFPDASNLCQVDKTQTKKKTKKQKQIPTNTVPALSTTGHHKCPKITSM